MKRRLKKYMSVVLTVSLAMTLMPAAVWGAEAEEGDGVLPPALVQVGDGLDFEGGGLPGTVTGAPATDGPGSVAVTEFFGNHVLRVQPPADTDSNTARQASYWWTLPLDSGEYDLRDKDKVEVSFDWWVDITRPNANSLDVRLNNGEEQVLTLRTRGSGTSADSPAAISYYSGNMNSGNEPATGTAITALTGVPRLTRLSATIQLDLLAQQASIHLTDGASLAYATPQPIAIASDKLTSISVGASRASGQSWARFNAADGLEWDEHTYGMRVDNMLFRAAASGGDKPVIPPSEIAISPASADLEYGEGSLADKHTADFNAVVMPVNATGRTFTWSIGDESIATIAVNQDQSVTVTGVGEGQTMLTAISNMDDAVVDNVPITVKHVPATDEPAPDFSALLADGYTQEFGSHFAGEDQNPLWIFEGSNYHSLAREDAPRINHYFRFDASGSGNRGGQGVLPHSVFGSKVYAHLDWKVPAVTTAQNTFNLSFQHGANVLLSLRTGTHDGQRTIGAFTGALPGPTGPDPSNFWNGERYHAFSYNEVNIWYTVGIEFDFDDMMATVSLVPRDDAGALPSVLEIPFEGSQISSFVLTGERAGGNNIGIADNGIDNLFFFTKPLSPDTITEVLPYDFLRERPATADPNTWQSWMKTVYIGDVDSEAGLDLPTTINVKVAGGQTEPVGVTWKMTEAPWARPASELVYDPNKQGVYSYEGSIGNVPGAAVNRMGVKAKLYIENRHQTKLTTEPLSMEWLDRGVTAVPESSGEGILVTWRLLASEYNKDLTFNVYRNGDKINASPVATLNMVDTEGEAGDIYVVETVNTGDKSKTVTAWAHNYVDIPLQKPADRPNPALVYGAASNADPITYTANDMAVADVNGDGQYEILVKWYPSQAQDPGLPNRHTGETIFDLYTLEGELLWRINLGINIVSSAHHSAFNFYDLDQDGKAEFSVKTADGTRVYLPKADGTIDDLTDTPAWVLGEPEAVWVGGLQNPANDYKVNNTALGRVASGPETLTVFDGATGEPMDTVDYFAPYSINPNWGDSNNNRSDRFNGAVAYMPKNGVPGAEPYPTVIEVRGHYGPHYVAAYQWIDGQIENIWTFTLAGWNAGGNQGNHNLKVADVDFDGYSEVVLGAITIDQDGTVLWSSNGTRGTTVAGHGDALHVGAMVPDSDEIYVFQPHESGPPNNVTLVRGSTGEPLWTYSANVGDVGRGVAANVTPLPGFEVWGIETPMYNIVNGKVITTDVGGIGVVNKAPVNFILYWDGDLLSEFFDGPDNYNATGAPSITKFQYDVETGESGLETLQILSGTYSNNGTKANPGLIADIFGDWRDEVLVRTSDNQSLRIYTTDIPTDHVIYTLMHDPQYRLATNSQNAMYNQPAHLGFYLGEDIRDDVQQMRLPVPNIYYTSDGEGPTAGNAALSPAAATYYTNAPADIKVTVSLNGNTLTGIRKGDRELTGADYSVSAVTPDGKQTVTIKSRYLATLSNGDVLTFDFSAGESAELNISVTARTIYEPAPNPVTPAPSPAPAVPNPAPPAVDSGTPDDSDSSGTDSGSAAPKPVLNNEIANAEQIRADMQQALQAIAPLRFSDVPESHWAAKSIRYASQLGIVQGSPNGEFRGSEPVTRAEFAAMIVRSLGIDATGEGASFPDTRDHWASAYIGALYRLGVVNGTGNGAFTPNGKITRAEMSAILARVLNGGTDNAMPAFSDISGHWAAADIGLLSQAGIVNGISDGRFAPNDTATREQSAVILVRMLNTVLDLDLDL